MFRLQSGVIYFHICIQWTQTCGIAFILISTRRLWQCLRLCVREVQSAHMAFVFVKMANTSSAVSGKAN